MAFDVSSPASTAAMPPWAQLLAPSSSCFLVTSADLALVGEVQGQRQAGQPAANDQDVEMMGHESMFPGKTIMLPQSAAVNPAAQLPACKVN